MSLFEKGGFFAIIGVYIIIQVFTIATEYSGTRTILIKKEIYGKRVDSVTHDSIVTKGLETRTYEAFHVKIKAKTFWNKLLLTNEDGNLMSEIFKIATSLALAWYVFRLQPENVFTGKSLNYFWLTALLFIGIPESFTIGAMHTRDFWRDYYISKGGTKTDSYDFFGDTHMSWLYYWCFMLAFGLYRILKEKYEEKLKQGEKPSEDLSTIN